MRGLQIGVRLDEQLREQRSDLPGFGDAESGEGLLVRVMGHREPIDYKRAIGRRQRTIPAEAKTENGFLAPPAGRRRARKDKCCLLRFFCSGLRCEGLGLFRELRETGRVLHRDVGQHFAVEFDARGLEAVNELAVADAVQARGGADALDPQPAVLALLGAAVAERIAIGAICRFLRRLVQLALGEEKALGPLEVLLAPSPALAAAFHACHGFAPLTSLPAGEAGAKPALRDKTRGDSN